MKEIGGGDRRTFYINGSSQLIIPSHTQTHTNKNRETHTLLVVQHLVHTAYTHCQRHEKEAAEPYTNGLYGGHEDLCGREGMRAVKYYRL